MLQNNLKDFMQLLMLVRYIAAGHISVKVFAEKSTKSSPVRLFIKTPITQPPTFYLNKHQHLLSTQQQLT